MMFKYLLIYFICINLLGMLVNISDKSRAKKEKWRIKEQTLWLIALSGGAPLSYITMKAIRHKTKHMSFMIGMPVLALIEIGLMIYFYIIMN